MLKRGEYLLNDFGFSCVRFQVFAAKASEQGTQWFRVKPDNSISCIRSLSRPSNARMHLTPLSMVWQICSNSIANLPIVAYIRSISWCFSRMALPLSLHHRIDGSIAVCIFRLIPATYSAPFRPPIPLDSGHLFRNISATL